jgi:hypothetical protein
MPERIARIKNLSDFRALCRKWNDNKAVKTKKGYVNAPKFEINLIKTIGLKEYNKIGVDIIINL